MRGPVVTNWIRVVTGGDTCDVRVGLRGCDVRLRESRSPDTRDSLSHLQHLIQHRPAGVQRDKRVKPGNQRPTDG